MSILMPNENCAEAMPETCSPYKEPSYENEKFHVDIQEGVLGLRVSIGCQTFYTEDVEKATNIVSYFFKNKIRCIKAYHNGDINSLLKEVIK